MINISNHVTLWRKVKNQIPFLVIHSETTKNVIKILITLRVVNILTTHHYHHHKLLLK
jgi:hypothetical protein